MGTMMKIWCLPIVLGGALLISLFIVAIDVNPVNLQPRTISNTHFFEISQNDTTDYGFNYPITFSFTLPNTNMSFLAWHRHSSGERWVQLPEKMSNDFFNDEEVVRFDSDIAYVSVGFCGKPQLQILLTDSEGYSVQAVYSGMPKYYDNRKSAVMTTYDDFQVLNMTLLQEVVDAHQRYKIWFGAGIVTTHQIPWEFLRKETKEGYLEPCSHSATHPRLPYTDYDNEIGGSKEKILDELNNCIPYGNFVLVWIEPHGESDITQLQKCGEYKYLISRGLGGQQISDWNPSLHLFNEVGPTTEATDTAMLIFDEDDEPCVSPIFFNIIFDRYHNDGNVYFLFAHIGTRLTYIDAYLQHLLYVSGRKDVWYPPVGMFYLYQYARLFTLHK